MLKKYTLLFLVFLVFSGGDLLAQVNHLFQVISLSSGRLTSFMGPTSR
jgi:hypothetical protein